MGVNVEITTNAGFQVQAIAARRRAMLRGGAVLLDLARVGAPYQTGQMRADSRVELEITAAGDDRVAIIFGRYYAPWIEEKDIYEHPHGHAHFLERALVDGHRSALVMIAESMRASMGGGE